VEGGWEREGEFAPEHRAPRTQPATKSKTQKKEIA
jgi:hypothetical protein